MITISLAQWEQREPGHLEGDLVAHCGNTTAGVYVNTLTVTDIAPVRWSVRWYMVTAIKLRTI